MNRFSEHSGVEPPSAYAITAGPSAPGVTVLVLEGELDLAAAPALRAAVAAVAPADALVLDLSGVTFVDSSILRELLQARRVPARLVLAGVPPAVRRLLDLTHTGQLFEQAPDAAAAVTRLSR